MLVNSASQNHFSVERSSHRNARQGSGSYHRRSVSCLAVASHHEHYEHPSYLPAASGRYYDTIELNESSAGDASSASPDRSSRHVQRKSEGNISLDQLQRGLSGAGVTTTDAATESTEGTTMVSVSSSLGGKLIKLNPAAPTPRRSLLSDLLNSQGSPSRLEQNANRRRMLKSMRRYSVDISEMNFNLGHPSGQTSALQGIPAEGEGPLASEGAGAGTGSVRQEFTDTPTVRYLRNPCHATVKTKLQSSLRSPFVPGVRRGGEDAPDYFGAEDRVW